MASSRSPISPTFRSGSSQGAPRTTNCTSAAVELASAIHNRHRVIIPTTACLALSSPRQSLGTGVPPRRLRIARILAFNFCVKWENQRETARTPKAGCGATDVFLSGLFYGGRRIYWAGGFLGSGHSLPAVWEV